MNLTAKMLLEPSQIVAFATTLILAMTSRSRCKFALWLRQRHLHQLPAPHVHPLHHRPALDAVARAVPLHGGRDVPDAVGDAREGEAAGGVAGGAAQGRDVERVVAIELHRGQAGGAGAARVVAEDRRHAGAGIGVVGDEVGGLAGAGVGRVARLHGCDAAHRVGAGLARPLDLRGRDRLRQRAGRRRREGLVKLGAAGGRQGSGQGSGKGGGEAEAASGGLHGRGCLQALEDGSRGEKASRQRRLPACVPLVVRLGSGP